MHFEGLSPLGAAWIPVYLAAVLGISLLTRRQHPASANDYLNATHSLSTWTASLAFLAYNCGSIEIVGMSAMAAHYGVQALHFYWIGGIPGMVFLGIVVVPTYVRTGARSLPEFLEIRFGPNLRLLNAVLSMLGTAALAGAALYALAQVMHVALGWSLLAGSVLSASIVMLYVLLGGIRATIYTSIFQFFVMVVGLLPLLVKTAGNIPRFADRPERWRLWASLPAINPHARLDRFGVIVGLGFVISFSYWCTDFVIVQRTLTARALESARKVPVLAGFGKLLMGFLVVLPGVAAPVYLAHRAQFSYDEAVPQLMRNIYGPTLLGLGVAALLASLMAGFAGNLSGFAAAWTQEVYRARLRPGRGEEHYIAISRWAATGCFLLAALAAWIATQFGDLMEFLQMIVSLFYAPLFAVVLAAFASRRNTDRQACAGVVLGSGTALAIQIAPGHGSLFGSSMTANFYVAVISFSVAALACVPYGKSTPAMRPGMVPITGADKSWLRPSPSLVVLSALLLLSCLVVNLVWW